MLIVGIITFVKSPELLKRRLNAKEGEDEQKMVILVSGIIFILAFILAGLNFRFRWFELPETAITIASVIFLLSYIMYAEVLRENTYLSRTVEVSENQKVVDSGLYGIVRHPMYTSTIFLFLSMPIILNSIFSFIIMLIYPIIIIFRIKNEEKVLERELKGYNEYKEKVKYKIIPFII
ncbi:isoprenylcysteine carboxylmethyltransferase family protein [uncultured Methanobrevibacter sp.]|uniref:methyltransferase family protein n=1 Tax=uncultured Methanobrevibacter sp. TaxID=253161 RepID=UPI0026163E7C|nr:isoprenylcysteine carboxylmethyltransferase family protein [uncultured Methanobrevibacter sp.]